MKKTKCAWKKSILVGTNNHSFFILVDSQNYQNAQWTPPLCFSRPDDRKTSKQALRLCMLFQNSIRQATEQTTMGRAERVPPASWLCAMCGTAAVDGGPSACSTSGPRGSSGRPSSSPAWTQAGETNRAHGGDRVPVHGGGCRRLRCWRMRATWCARLQMR